MTAAQKRHEDAIRGMRCITCYAYPPSVCHHLRGLAHGTGTGLKSKKAIPLCAKCHQGHGYGASYHDGPAAWEGIFGTQQELWEKTQRRMKNDGLPHDW